MSAGQLHLAPDSCVTGGVMTHRILGRAGGLEAFTAAVEQGPADAQKAMNGCAICANAPRTRTTAASCLCAGRSGRAGSNERRRPLVQVVGGAVVLVIGFVLGRLDTCAPGRTGQSRAKAGD